MFRGIVRTIHFVGIGGIGMSGIAEVMLNLGFRVTGSDLKAGVAVQRLRALGAEVLLGHVSENVGDADVVVYSSAVKPHNPELVEATGRGIPVIQRAEMLAELMRLKHGIAIAGTHGKTTTTSMVAACLAAGGLDPTVVIGGRLDSLGGTNAKLGQGEYLVAEADESDGTFMLLSPTIALITNIDPEHLDHWGEFARTVEAFESFANKVPFYGFTVACVDHVQVAALLPKVRRRVVTYGLARHAHYRASHIERDGLSTTFRVHRGDDELGQVRLGMPGVHNVTNAVGAVALSCELGVPFDTVQGALEAYSGVQRRFTLVGEAQDVMIVDDYGHHPVEIDATLSAAEGGFPERRIIAVFQPHRFSRVAALWSEFCSAFHRADIVLVCPVYAAGESPMEGIDAPTIAAEMRDRGHRGAEVVGSLEEATTRLIEMVRPGDIVITLGAGDVNRICGELHTHLLAQA